MELVDLDETFGIVLAGEGWHPGIIGIVASRIVEEFGRPAVLIAVENGVGKGSGRSIAPFDLHAALTACADCFVRFGGHRAAAGITILPERIPEFAARFNAVARERLTPDDLIPELRVDMNLPLAAATEDFLKLLKHCEPHGIGNPAPVFVARGVHADAKPKRIGDTGIRAKLTDDAVSLDAIAWDFAHRLADIDWTAPMDVAYRLERDEWNGRSRLQARLADVRPAHGA
jgi:single-stranded-DNA-specific exonuclease